MTQYESLKHELNHINFVIGYHNDKTDVVNYNNYLHRKKNVIKELVFIEDLMAS